MSWRSSRRQSAPETRDRKRRSAARDRGAVFIEFALLVPVLVLFAMGIVEFGLGWKWANDVNAAARDGGRSGTNMGVIETADRSVLTAIGYSLSEDQRDNLVKVIVYRAAGPDGEVPPTCKSMMNASGSSSSPGSAVGRSSGGIYCNVYGRGQIEYALHHPVDDGPWVNAAKTGCPSSAIDKNWCPATRARNIGINDLDYLGVYVEVKKPSITNAGFAEQRIERSTVFRLEPKFKY